MAKLRRRKQAKLTITETEPVPIVRDFDRFIDYLREHKFTLTKTNQVLPRKTLYEINQLMTNPNRENTPRTDQYFYPLLHLFYYIALSGKLFVKVSDGAKKAVMQRTQRLDEYKRLTPTEKYFFLLETFWVDCNWAKLKGDSRRSSPIIFQVASLMTYLARMPFAEVIYRSRSGENLRFALQEGYFLQYLSLFGFFEMTRDEELYEDSLINASLKFRYHNFSYNTRIFTKISQKV